MRQLQAAAVARAESVWNANQVHEVGAVPDVPTTPYLVVSVSGGGAANTRSDGTHGSASHRVIVQAAGKTAGEVMFALEKADTAFQDYALTATGLDVTKASSELVANIYRDPDAGSLLTVTQTYAFHVYPA